MKGDEPVESETFAEAFTAMYNWVNEQIAKGELTYQALEMAIWIETPLDGVTIDFFTARDMACDLGLMEKLQKMPLFEGEFLHKSGNNLLLDW